jgi:hypothetical protein
MEIGQIPEIFYEWNGGFIKYHKVGVISDDKGQIVVYRYFRRRWKCWVSKSWYFWEWKGRHEIGLYFEDPKTSKVADLWKGTT